ncbi:N-6 DNA methylase [Micromonospora sp. NBC_01405]|uniref:N-6 DNA methylase n=1 Tax=Micromonospora sp. NBC_01405 TaxID=2903589 RepID=UPI0032554E71
MVGRAAVSNWRKRHADFPTPMGGSAASPEFDLAQVERWLRGQGKLGELSTADRIWRHLAGTGSSPAAGLAAVGTLLLARRRGERPRRQPVDPHLAPLLPDLDALAEERGPQGAFDELWQRFAAHSAGRPAATPDDLADLADLMVGLAGVGGGTVLDPAAGTGALLRAAARAGCTAAYGQELDPDLAALAGLWLALHDAPGQVRPGDSLRAVIALPPGVGAAHGVPLHLWVLRRAAADAPPPARALLVDAAGSDPAALSARVLAAWQAFTAAGDAEVDQAGFARAVPVIELLDEDVDLTPARRQPAAGGEATGERLVRTRERLAALVADLPALMPRVVAAPDGPPENTLTVGELARTGALELIGPIKSAGPDGPDSPPDGPPVLTAQDVLDGRDASGRDGGRLGQDVPLAVGDVVVPMIALQLTPRVVTAEGALLGRNLYLLRPNPAALDPWFLAGQLRTSANERQASSLSGTLRFDLRLAQVRRLPLGEQRAQGEAFRRLAAFESAIRQAAALGAELVQLTADGLASGGLLPADDPQVRRNPLRSR